MGVAVMARRVNGPHDLARGARGPQCPCPFFHPKRRIQPPDLRHSPARNPLRAASTKCSFGVLISRDSSFLNHGCRRLAMNRCSSNCSSMHRPSGSRQVRPIGNPRRSNWESRPQHRLILSRSLSRRGACRQSSSSPATRICRHGARSNSRHSERRSAARHCTSQESAPSGIAIHAVAAGFSPAFVEGMNA